MKVRWKLEMKTQLKIDGVMRDVEVHEDLSITILKPKERKQTGWEQVVDTCGDSFFTTDLPYNEPLEMTNLHSWVAQALYKYADYFSDKNFAQNIIQAQNIWRKLMRWQAENDDAVDWNNENSYKYYIWYDRDDKALKYDHKYVYCDMFMVYFSSEEKVKEAIDVFYDDLIWLFTKFKSRMDQQIID